jgi:hypothetical protein
MVRPRALGFLILVLLAPPTALASSAIPSSFGPVSRNPADRLAQLPIEDYRYDHARRCRQRPTAGALALESWLEAHVAGESWGIMRCEKLGRDDWSLHAEGRALDWHLDARTSGGRSAGHRLLKLLLATDRSGNAFALARRMGVQELIWDCRAWWSGSESFVDYTPCYGKNGKRRRHVDPTIAHLNHIHIGLNWQGARRKTSFWRAR